MRCRAPSLHLALVSSTAPSTGKRGRNAASCRGACLGIGTRPERPNGCVGPAEFLAGPSLCGGRMAARDIAANIGKGTPWRNRCRALFFHGHRSYGAGPAPGPCQARCGHGRDCPRSRHHAPRCIPENPCAAHSAFARRRATGKSIYSSRMCSARNAWVPDNGAP